MEILTIKKFFTLPTKNFVWPTLRALDFGDSDLVWWFLWPKWWFCGKKIFWVSGSKKCLLIDRTARAGFFKSNFRPIMWLSSLRWSYWEEKKFSFSRQKILSDRALRAPPTIPTFSKITTVPDIANYSTHFYLSLHRIAPSSSFAYQSWTSWTFSWTFPHSKSTIAYSSPRLPTPSPRSWTSSFQNFFQSWTLPSSIVDLKNFFRFFF